MVKELGTKILQLEECLWLRAEGIWILCSGNFPTLSCVYTHWFRKRQGPWKCDVSHELFFLLLLFFKFAMGPSQLVLTATSGKLNVYNLKFHMSTYAVQDISLNNLWVENDTSPRSFIWEWTSAERFKFRRADWVPRRSDGAVGCARVMCTAVPIGGTTHRC